MSLGGEKGRCSARGWGKVWGCGCDVGMGGECAPRLMLESDVVLAAAGLCGGSADLLGDPWWCESCAANCCCCILQHTISCSVFISLRELYN